MKLKFFKRQLALLRFNARCYHWPKLMFVLSFIKVICDSINNFCSNKIDRKFNYQVMKLSFLERWLVEENGKKYFNFKGAYLPDITNDDKVWECFYDDFPSVLFFHCYCNNKYSKINIEKYNHLLGEGVYCYKNDNVDVTIKKGDIVIDAGSFIGDFAAFAASQKAFTYAFEPSKKNYQILTQTAELNKPYIKPLRKGLGSKKEILQLLISNRSGGNSLLDTKFQRFKEIVEGYEEIDVTTIDSFVKEDDLDRIDFIKADIEGFERHMLEGAIETLRVFEPKLAISTYHLEDDPQVLELIIKNANPRYQVFHTKNRIFASVNKA